MARSSKTARFAVLAPLENRNQTAGSLAMGERSSRSSWHGPANEIGAVQAFTHVVPSSEMSMRGPSVPVSFEKLNASAGASNVASETHFVIAAEYGNPCENRIAMSPDPAQPRLEVRNGAAPSQRSKTAGNFVQIEPPE